MSKRYTLESDLDPIVRGEVDLPNFEKGDLGNIVSNIAALGHGLLPKWGYAKINGRKEWAQYFLTPAGMGSVQSGSFDGGGFVLLYAGYPHGGIGGTFAICKHEKMPGPGANPMRGWHPGACLKCGMDMTIDSGD